MFGLRLITKIPLHQGAVGTNLVLAEGSIVNCTASAIVNAANTQCLGGEGGGVDGAITKAGGAELAESRAKLPVAPFAPGTIRCPTGSARVTPAGGKLQSGSIIHAVGPDYNSEIIHGRSIHECDVLLENAYRASMRCARQEKFRSLAFVPLSSGLFRGPKTLDEVITIGMATMVSELYPELENLLLVAYRADEVRAMENVATTLFPHQTLVPGLMDTEAFHTRA